MALLDNEKNRFIDPDTQRPTVRVASGISIPQHDKVDFTYPNNTTDVVTYSLNGSTVAIITITYTNSSKSELLQVVKT